MKCKYANHDDPDFGPSYNCGVNDCLKCLQEKYADLLTEHDLLQRKYREVIFNIKYQLYYLNRIMITSEQDIN